MSALSGGCACGRVRYECEEVSIVDLFAIVATVSVRAGAHTRLCQLFRAIS